MAKPGKGKTLISVTVPNDLVKVMDARAEALSWSRAQFALAIFEQWKAAGYPAVSETDHLLAISRQGKGRKAG